MISEEFRQGYEAAYTELYAAIDSEDHPGRCAGCRPCVLFRALLKSIMKDLRQRLTADEVETLNSIMMKAKTDG